MTQPWRAHALIAFQISYSSQRFHCKVVWSNVASAGLSQEKKTSQWNIYIYIYTPSINHLISSRSKTGIKNYFHLCRKALADLTTVKQTASFIFLLVTLTMEPLYTSASNTHTHTHTHTDSGYLGLQVSYHFQYQLVCLLISVLIGWF